MAVGDAALALDPLSSTGTSFALASGKCAADEVLFLQPPGTYTSWVSRHWSRYLHESATVYQIEARWSESNFWQRRAFAADSSFLSETNPCTVTREHPGYEGETFAPADALRPAASARG